MGTTARQIGAAMMWSVLARVVRFVLGMASSVLVVRSLGDHDYGVLSLVRAILMFVVILCSAGLGQAALRYLPALRVERSSSQARRLVRYVLVLHLLLWVAAAVLSYLLRGVVGMVFDYQGFGAVVAYGVSLVVFELFFNVISQILNSNYDTRVLSIASIVSHVVYIAALVLVMLAHWGVVGVLAAAAAGNLAALVMIVPRLRPATDFGEEPTSYRVDRTRVLRYAAPFAAVGVLNLIVWRQSETIFLGHFRGAEETGYFDLAYRVAQIALEFVPATVWPLVMAGVSEVYARNSAALAAAIDRYYRMLFILCAPICFTGIVLGGRMVSILFGAQMEPAAVPTQIFFAIFTMSFFGTPLSMALYVMEKTHVNLVIYVFLAVANVALDLLLIPKYGVTGAMIPVACIVGIGPVIYRAVVGRLVAGVGIPYRFIARCFLASSSVFLLIPLLRFVGGPAALAGAFVAAAVLLTLSFKLVRVVGAEEREMLGSIPIPLAGRLIRFVSF